jgi:hypothetical protein
LRDVVSEINAKSVTGSVNGIRNNWVYPSTPGIKSTPHSLPLSDRPMHKLQKFISLPKPDKLLFTEALLLIFLARMMLTMLPFRLCIKTIRATQYPHDAGADKLRQIRNALDRAIRLTSWKNVCLVQSFAARWMLQRRHIGSVLSIGAMHSPQKKLVAHAWISAGNFEVVSRGGNFTPLTTF